MSCRHYDNNCSSLRFTLHKLSISENRPCRSHRCPADTNELIVLVVFMCQIYLSKMPNELMDLIFGRQFLKNVHQLMLRSAGKEVELKEADGIEKVVDRSL